MSKEILNELAVIVRTASTMGAVLFLLLFVVLINKRFFSLYSPAQLNLGGTCFMAVGTVIVNVNALAKNTIFTPATFIQFFLAGFFILHILALIYYDRYVLGTELIDNIPINRGDSG